MTRFLESKHIQHVPDNGEHAYTVPASALSEIDFDPFQSVINPTTQEEDIGFHIQFNNRRQLVIYHAEGLCTDEWIDWWLFRSPDGVYELAILNDHAILERDDQFGELVDLDELNEND